MNENLEWKVTKRTNNTLELALFKNAVNAIGQGTNQVLVGHDGCIHLYQCNLPHYTADEHDEEVCEASEFHICDLDTYISTLTALHTILKKELP